MKLGGENMTMMLAAIAALLLFLVWGIGFADVRAERPSAAALSNIAELAAKDVCSNRGYTWGVKKNRDGFAVEVDCIFTVARAPQNYGAE